MKLSKRIDLEIGKTQVAMAVSVACIAVILVGLKLPKILKK